MPLIAEYSTTARPDRGIVQVYDADAYLGDDETLARSRTEVVAGNGYHLYLHSLQADIEVQVTIKVWDGPQKPPEDIEGTVALTLESETGQLVVNQLTYGPARRHGTSQAWRVRRAGDLERTRRHGRLLRHEPPTLRRRGMEPGTAPRRVAAVPRN